MSKKKYALISVYNKSNLKDICQIFKKFGIEIISTNKTGKHISKLGFKNLNISSLTNFKEILSGRVKSLHPKIHASLLFKRNDKKQVKEFISLDFPIIDFIVVNLYPFEKVIDSVSDENECIEMIDIGGPTLLRSSAKNFNSVTTITNPDDYNKFINEMVSNRGQTSIKFRSEMATKAFLLTHNYDKIIYRWFNCNKKSNKIKNIKYGENPHQNSEFRIKDNNKSYFTHQLHGKNIGYNNILDIDSGLNCLNEFKLPTCVIIKHGNPCGVASAKKINLAFARCLNSDPKSAFGGVLLINKTIDENIALKICEQFFEIIIAPSFNKKILRILTTKKKMIIIESKKIVFDDTKEIRSVSGGFLKQDKNNVKININTIKNISNKKATKKQIEDLIFALKVCKHVKSNAIVLASNSQTLGIGAGQMNRSDSTNIAIIKYKAIFNKRNYVAASDAFFPFNDNVKKLYENNCRAIVQPIGSINDKKIIDFGNKIKLPIYSSKYRFFKH